MYVDYNDSNNYTYYYDDLGNRKKLTNGGTLIYKTNKLNQYTEVGGMDFTYDKNGNLTFDGQFRYYYDSENRLTDVNNAADEPVASYKYDWMGRRVRKIVFDPASHRRQASCGEPLATSDYLYDGWRCIREYTDAGAVIRSYFYGVGIDEPVWSNGSGNIYYYHYDGLGSVIALSNASGELIEKYEYDVFGEVTIEDEDCAWLGQSNVGNPYLFTARRYDYESGTYYYRARYYSPAIGRFLQVDPEYYVDGSNIYTYGLNDPINTVDPFGLACSYLRIEGNLKITSLSKEGTCPPDFAIKNRLEDKFLGGFPKVFKDESCPPCHHCKWGPERSAGTVTVKVSGFTYTFEWGWPITFTCTIRVDGSLVFVFTSKTGECVKDD